MQTVLITGIDSGIGKALMEKFLQEGFFVIGTSLEKKEDKLISENNFIFNLDLRSSDSIKDCILKIKELNLKIDILINNAGVMLDLEEIKIIKEKLRETLEVNLIGPIDFTEQILSEIKEGGHILNISSSAGSMDRTGKDSRMLNHYPSYKISKVALNMYSKILALRLGNKIIVSAVRPGWTRTNMGGEDAPNTPEKSAEDIFNFALTRPETGQFWFKGEKTPW